jgi:hypothetical protein
MIVPVCKKYSHMKPTQKGEQTNGSVGRTPCQEFQTEASLLALLPDSLFTSNMKTG